MSERPAVVLALSPLAERAIEPLLFGPGAPLEARASIAEADELEHEAAALGAEALILSADLSGLSASHCARARAQGLRLVGLALGGGEREALLALGVDEVVEASTSREALVGAVRGHQQADGGGRAAKGPPPAAAPLARTSRRTGAGSVLAVVGSKGAPGASELAASLAALAGERWPTLLVELDALGGGLDVRLGADPRQGSLLGLVRAVRSGASVSPELLERWLAGREGWPPVLLGPPEPQQALTELARPGAVAAALRALAELQPLLVCDVGFLLAPETGAAASVHRETLVAADAVVLVLGARDEQLRAGLEQLDLLLEELGVPAERLRVVVNGGGAPGANTGAALTETLAERLAGRGLALDGALPWDGRALLRAARRGLPLALAQRRGHYARALARLLDELFLPVAPLPRGRKQRLSPPTLAEEEEVALPWRS